MYAFYFARPIRCDALCVIDKPQHSLMYKQYNACARFNERLSLQPNRSLGLKRVIDLQTLRYAYDTFSALTSIRCVLFECSPITTTFWCFAFHALTAAQVDVSSYLDL